MIVSQHILLDMIQVNSDEGKSLQLVGKVTIMLGKIFMVLYLPLKMVYSLISHIPNFVNLHLLALGYVRKRRLRKKGEARTARKAHKPRKG
jgi:hypothetical protein